METMISENITHEIRDSSLEKTKQELIKKIQNRGDLPYASVARQLELLEQLTQFKLGKYLIQRGGLNGYWIHYALMHPKKGRLTGVDLEGKPFHSLEAFLLDRAPVTLATQERLQIFKSLIQKKLFEGCHFASIPSGLMEDLSDLNFSSLNHFTLQGIDIDEEVFKHAEQFASEKKVLSHCLFSLKNAWDLGVSERFDLISSNGLTIYEPDDTRVIDLYKGFHKALKSNGSLITSFLTPPPLPGLKTEWKLDQVNSQDALLQKILFTDILSGKWQIYRPEQKVKEQLKQAGFGSIEIHYDRAHIFPTVSARKI